MNGDGPINRPRFVIPISYVSATPIATAGGCHPIPGPFRHLNLVESNRSPTRAFFAYFQKTEAQLTVNRKLWQPADDACVTTHMGRYLMHVQETFPEEGVVDFDTLFRWTVGEYQQFWADWLEYSEILFEGSAKPVLEQAKMPDARFFPGVRLNFAENLLRNGGGGLAIQGISESRATEKLSWDDLRHRVSQVAQALRDEGVGVGDRVAAVLPNIAEAVIAALATASIGAVWSSCSPDFGQQAVLERFGQITPRVILGVNGYVHNGKTIDCGEKFKAIVEELPSVEQAIVLELVPSSDTLKPDDNSKMRLWDDWISSDPVEMVFERFPFEHPLVIMYSSGTSGPPKCIVHGAGGTLLQQVKELLLHCDLRADDNLLYVTTTGWMMWNWMLTGLYAGASITLFDGFPARPSLNRLWDVVADCGITHFGTSPKFLSACRRRLDPKSSYDLSKLRVILSTGAPLAKEEFEWVYEHVKSDIQMSSISGGTDIISCFMLGNPLLPVFCSELQCYGLGMDVRIGEGDSFKGELVCCTPFVSMPIGFWNDTDGSRYNEAYFSRGDGHWWHGDLIELTGSQGSCGGVVVHGRSDATLKPGGVRIGTAEIYRVVEALVEVDDSIVVGQPWRGDIRVVLFVKLAEDVILGDKLKDRIRNWIRQETSARHVPSLIIEVPEIPYTRSGKKVELAVRAMICGDELSNRESIANPASLDNFEKL
ncbi:MAG: acetoacetate--CoA ligase [Planctomycetaceae bacterium]|jgi:acetoacetyl-CoA synthetase|nr:acetoacetate--CoA ligase [Planctomycetaceae bacterium]MBT4725539.1 acetoacetate--CoA ligase [Planctomycetaceae bacterium]MBT5125541.1 acetoacetate--CoA ligase [Planctomycetaceae bacterium]MBT5599737.1 acetoacetate--CoA ligase [Planctomycetaceae bacterium]MBT5885254.1 acetoacetate--CoA ligase [Planctomycetaceae bacterium]